MRWLVPMFLLASCVGLDALTRCDYAPISGPLMMCPHNTATLCCAGPDLEVCAWRIGSDYSTSETWRPCSDDCAGVLADVQAECAP